MHLLFTFLLIWACATASACTALLVVVAVQRVARVLGHRRTAPAHSVPYPGPAVGSGRNMVRA